MSLTEDSLFINWTDESNIGIPIIDEQHRSVVGVINTIYFYKIKGSNFDIIEPIFSLLDQYMIIHFKTEESLLKEYGYPDIEEHKRLHQNIAHKYNVQKKIEFKKKELSMMLLFLKNWWLYHITSEDKKYVPFLIEKEKSQF